MPTPLTDSSLFSLRVGLGAEGKPTDFHYVAMDFGGHGLSSHYSQGFPYYHQNFVSEVRRVAAALKWNRFSLLGHSFGGTVGGMFSCIFPEMVDKLILLDALPVVLDTNEMDNLLTYKRRAIEHVLQVEASRKPVQVVSPEEMLQWFLKNNSHVGEANGKHLLQRGTTQAATALWYFLGHKDPTEHFGVPRDESVIPGVWLNRDRRITLPEHCFNIVGKELFVQYIKNLQARILFIKATEGYYAVRRENDADRESIMFGTNSLKSVLKERFQYVEVPGNHYIHMNQPQLVADVISSFLQSKERSPGPCSPGPGATATCFSTGLPAPEPRPPCWGPALVPKTSTARASAMAELGVGARRGVRF